MSTNSTERPIVAEPRRSASISRTSTANASTNRQPAGTGTGANLSAEIVDVPPHLPAHGTLNNDGLLETTRRHLEEARLRLEGHDLSGRIINNATSRIKKEALLNINGTNLAQWIKDLKELGR